MHATSEQRHGPSVGAHGLEGYFARGATEDEVQPAPSADIGDGSAADGDFGDESPKRRAYDGIAGLRAGDVALSGHRYRSP
jgi:hypothetical protein